jgi:hypothetical protein
MSESEYPFRIDIPSGGKLEAKKMSIRVLPRATDKAVANARRTWPEATAADFERTGKLWVDKATGIAYRRVAGDPEAGGTGRADVAVWFISGDELGDGIVYLQKADAPGSALTEEIGEVGGRRMTAQDVLR